MLKNGEELRAANHAHGYLLLWDEGADIGHTRTLEAENAIQSFPLLLVNGEVISDSARNIENVAQRSAAALTLKGDLLLVATDAELVGLTIPQLTVFLRGLGARNAIALDAGSLLTTGRSKRRLQSPGMGPHPGRLGRFFAVTHPINKLQSRPDLVNRANLHIYQPHK